MTASNVGIEIYYGTQPPDSTTFEIDYLVQIPFESIQGEQAPIITGSILNSAANTANNTTLTYTKGPDNLNDRGDFEEFSDELERSYGMDFYDIACDTIAQDLTPDWFDKIIGKDPEDEVVFATEIGPGDTTINVHLNWASSKYSSSYI